jgi:hypothetical protein
MTVMNAGKDSGQSSKDEDQMLGKLLNRHATSLLTHHFEGTLQKGETGCSTSMACAVSVKHNLSAGEYFLSSCIIDASA